jgi:hypothetical protein
MITKIRYHSEGVNKMCLGIADSKVSDYLNIMKKGRSF